MESEVTNYNDGNWHLIPAIMPKDIHPLSEIEMVWKGATIGLTSDIRPASSFMWEKSNSYCDNIAFRVVKECRDHREYMIDPQKNIIWYSSEDGLVHVREVTK